MNGLFWSKLYLLTIPVFLAIDMVWLGVVARNLYKEQLHSLLSPQVNWTAAFLFYFIYIAGILFFAVRPGLEAGSLARACLYGALFGFFTYMTYDLTNYATLRVWSLKITLLDIIWGSALTALAAIAGYLFTRAVTRAK